MNPGDRVALNTRPFQGHDGKIYHIFAVDASGHNWQSRMYFAARGPGSFKGTVVEVGDHWAKARLDREYLNDQVIEFLRRPYVSRRTKKTGPHIRPTSTWTALGSEHGLYAIHHGQYLIRLR